MRTIYLAQDRVQWCEHSNEPSGSIKDKIFWLAEQLLVSQEGLCPMELVVWFVSNCIM
jgi:hypothetical protein